MNIQMLLFQNGRFIGARLTDSFFLIVDGRSLPSNDWVKESEQIKAWVRDIRFQCDRSTPDNHYDYTCYVTESIDQKIKGARMKSILVAPDDFRKITEPLIIQH